VRSRSDEGGGRRGCSEDEKGDEARIKGMKEKKETREERKESSPKEGNA